VVCYERADDIGFGVSGVVTRARGIRSVFPDLDPADIPMAARVKEEKVLYLLDPVGASRRSRTLRAADRAVRAAKGVLKVEEHAVELPWTPAFLHKGDGFIFSMGQLMQWMGGQVLASGAVQVWPGTPVAEALVADRKVQGVRLLDQGVDKQGRPEGAYMPGMDVQAALTVVADGPVGAVGRQLDDALGMPEGHHRRDWAVGMKFVVDLPEDTPLETGTVLHTFGFPEPEIFGFLYVHPDRVASVGIFVPSWFETPTRTTYRYLQHYVQHPYLWRWLKDAKLRSWGAKSILESGRRGEPLLAGDGFARIGEGSGSTNVLTSSGVDEAFTTGVQLGEAVIELLEAGKPFTKENLDQAYVARRRASWVETEGRVAEKARDGFQKGVVSGLVGMALAGFTKGKVALGEEPPHPAEKVGTVEEFYAGKIPADEIARIRQACEAKGVPLHDALMDRAGWPSVPLDGKLLVTHQDALLVGGKVQAPPGYADHVVFLRPELCRGCGKRVCTEICSAEAIRPGDGGVPSFDREKCVHCGACLWSCSERVDGTDQVNLQFRAGTGGLHSAEN
jgi:electron-transferring-flavoprotein dehydrogenase